MSPIVYGANGSPFVRKVRVFLAEKSIPYEMETVIPLNVSPEYKKLHPMGKIPAFRDGDVTLADSSIICAYLEKKYPTPPLYPSDPYTYAKSLWFEEYGDTALAQVIGGKIFFPKLVAPLFYQRTPDEAAIKKAFDEELPPLCDYLEGQLGNQEWIVGDAFSIGDIGIASQFINLKLCGLEVDARRWPKLAKYIATIHARPSFKKLLEEEAKTFKVAV